MGRLSGWLVTDGGEAVIGAEGLINVLDTWFGDRDLWRDDDKGLAPTLDETPGWSDWDSWNRTEKIENLRSLLESERDRAVLIPPDDELAERLTWLWENDQWRYPDDGGLAYSLDQLPGWAGWDSWSMTLPQLREWLTPLPAEWTGVTDEDGQPAYDPVPEPLPGRERRQVDGITEFYHEADGAWERVDPPDADPAQAGVTAGIYWTRQHHRMGMWLPYHAPSKMWLDPYASEWRPHEKVGLRSSPAAFDQNWQLYFRLTGDAYEYSPDGTAGWTSDPYSHRPDLKIPPGLDEPPSDEESIQALESFIADIQESAEAEGLSITEEEIIELLEEYLSDQPD